jgi:TldD protein
MRPTLVVPFLLFSFLPVLQAQKTPKSPIVPKQDVVLDVMKAELDRATTGLAKADPAPYFTAYSVEDEDNTVIVASNGALINSLNNRRRSADVFVRVGSPAFDNTHGEARHSGITTGSLPLADDRDALARELWRLTDREYKQASQTYLQAKTKEAVRAKEEDDSPDFSKESFQPQQTQPVAVPAKVDQKMWEDRMRRLSAEFNKYPLVYHSGVYFISTALEHRFISSEKNQVVTSTPNVRMMIVAQTTADDGMELLRVETFEAPEPSRLPPDSELIPKINTVAKDLIALRSAKLAEPYNGPALLSGRSAAVFFHEVLGHRVEGQRQRGDDEGMTFTKQVGKQVLPPFLSVSDDPTLKDIGGYQLSGYYTYDDEGMPARRVDVIQDGILKNFLMSRMPVKDFLTSNGHGRAQPGYMQVGRQGNLIVTSKKSVPEPELRKEFIEEIKKQGKPYGLYFEDIQGGFTLTTRSSPQAFQVLPVMVYRVYPDGRPDELVRGVDIVGTPLAALNRIMATGDKQFIFNGVCGAESGSVPVSAVAPAMLFSEIEVQRKAQSHERPPILPNPIEAASQQGGN